MSRHNVGVDPDSAAARLEQDEAARQIVENIGECFWSLSRDWKFTYFNYNAEAFYGLSRHDVVGKTFWDIFPDVVGSDYEHRYRRAMAEGVIDSFEGPSVVRPDRWVDVRIFPLADGIAVSFRDLTRRQEAERRALESRAELAALFSQVSAGLAETDINGYFVRVNDAFCRMVGRSSAELLRMSFQDITHHDDLPRNLEVFERTRTTGAPYDIEKRFVRPDGAVAWGRVSVSGVRDQEGRVNRVVAVCLDMTEQQHAVESLKASESRLRLALDAGRMAVWDVDARSGEITRSRGLTDVLSLAEDSRLTANAIAQNFFPGDRAHVQKVALQAIERGEKFFETEFRFYRHDAGWRWLQLRAEAHFDDAGQPAHYVGVVFDTTERKEAEDRLRSSEERLRLAQEAASVGTFDWDVASGRVSWSPKMFEMYGISPDTPSDALYEAWLDALHPDDRQRIDQETRTALARGGPFELQFRTLSADGLQRWVEGAGRVDHDAAGRAVRMVGANMDVSARKCAEQQLRESEQRLEATYEHAFVGMAEVDVEGRFLRVNEHVLTLTGYTRDELLGLSFAAITHEEDRDRDIENFRRQMAGELSAYTMEKRLRHKDGHSTWVELSASQVSDEEGRPRYGIRVVRDVTERKQAERQQRLLINELNHRVKNTLATVQAISAQTLGSSEIDPAVRDAFERRLSALARAHDVLTRENWEGANLRDVVREALSPHQPVEPRIDAQGPDIRIRPKTALALALALHELATNAIKYGALSNEAGTVSIAWTIEDAGDGASRFRFAWREQGGPAVAPPSRRGFGTRLLERGLAAELFGNVELTHPETGLILVVDAPLEAIKDKAPD